MPDTVKTAHSVAYQSNKVWTMPNQGDISIPANTTYPNGMESRLKESRFRDKEGVFYADFLRDMNTPNTDDPLFNGRRLKGEVIHINMENEHDDEVRLYLVRINSVTSNRVRK